MDPIEDGSNNTKGEDSFNSDPPTPGFMPDTWDIMNKFPHPDAAVLTKIHAFRKTFGTRLPVVSNLWLMLWEENLPPSRGQHPKASAVGSSFHQGLPPAGPGVYGRWCIPQRH